MQRATTKAKVEFAYLMAKHSQATLHDITRLMYYGSSYGRLATDACNRMLDKAEEAKWLRVTNAILAICCDAGCLPRFQNDPRGNTVKIQVSDGFTNDWGREGICVPTS